MGRRCTWSAPGLFGFDPDAAAKVREGTGGFETVPTVVVGGRAQVNPDPALVRQAIAGGAASVN